VLIYEGFAGIVRAILLFMHAPFSYGPMFYNGITWMTDVYLWGILSPLGLPTTILTSLVWLKFTLFRSKPPPAFDVFIVLGTLGATFASFFGSITYGQTLENDGVMVAGVNGGQNAAFKSRLQISIVVTVLSMSVFLISNILWVFKLSKLGAESKALADTARKCFKIMVVQLFFAYWFAHC